MHHFLQRPRPSLLYQLEKHRIANRHRAILTPDLNLSLYRSLSKVIITDADGGMTHAVETYLPGTVHLHCLWHVMKNVRKNCQGPLGRKTNRFFKLLYAAAFATTEDVSNLVRGRRPSNEAHPPHSVCTWVKFDCSAPSWSVHSSRLPRSTGRVLPPSACRLAVFCRHARTRGWKFCATSRASAASANRTSMAT